MISGNLGKQSATNHLYGIPNGESASGSISETYRLTILKLVLVFLSQYFPIGIAKMRICDSPAGIRRMQRYAYSRVRS